MRFFFAFIFFITFSCFSYAQETDNRFTGIPGDTIEGESTDTSIVYIIKKAPVTIKEKVEIERSKIKKYYYFTFALSSFLNSNRYKARSGSEELIQTLNSSTNSQPGLGAMIQLQQTINNNILGLSVSGRRLHEAFRYAPSHANAGGETFTFQNSYTYITGSVIVGKWFRKDDKLSYQITGGPSLDYLFGVSGYSLTALDGNFVYIAESISYKKINAALFLSPKLLYKFKHSYLEIAPYAFLSPFSMTKGNELYSIKRQQIGLSIQLTQELF